MRTKVLNHTKPAYFDTLAAALASENLAHYWPADKYIGYGQTIRVHVDDSSTYGRIIVIYRSDTGRYERPITYAC